jgi:hypothetical protein
LWHSHGQAAAKLLEASATTAGPALSAPKPIEGSKALGIGSEFPRFSADWFEQRAAYIPVRLVA